ncbi:GNAT family N-acetyltransferase [Pseudomonas sp. MAFF 302030]|jgi:ribosomal protein S18 acetylase RimI-like enzyme|uniref:GNAT family N-acetyltransferase n=1 Tax=Pseudomonas morbosilactucae TaxID=2938197 RepID=A0A9X1YUY6_9PSED|nr:GNAT family N-acetyltransferase [Pseudomonas morbosilactucae]MCK9798149.1 GNAT family N-acetyltransferase [Pseudomonas morbosilactucae]WEK07907.1 MAG: GNAT family N-acetyltransferase [Pseudomonas sp.]
MSGFDWRPAGEADLVFARDLARSNLLAYYIRHDLLWQDEAFDVAWAGRKNLMICNQSGVLGFVSLSRDLRALYIRELHVLEAWRGQGAGAWAIEQVLGIARAEQRRLLRLTVFNDNPARRLYERMGLAVVGQDECFLMMERPSL